jgi:hypothetical protein
VERHLKGEAQLNGRYDSCTLPEGNSTRGFSLDDDVATRLVSIIQKSIHGNDFWEVIDKIDTAGARLTPDEQQFYAMVAAIVYTGEPQELSLWSSTKRAGHVVVCYKIDKGKFYVADPNYIGDESKFVSFTNQTFDSYRSAENANDARQGNLTVYNRISFVGQTSLYRWDLMGPLWTEMESGTIGRTRFPHYALRVTERDQTGAVTDEYELDLLNDHNTTRSSLEVSLDADFEGELVVYKYAGGTPSEQSSTTVTLDPGENLIGYLVRGKPTEDNPDGAWFWVGFEWVTAVYTGPEPEPEPTAPCESECSQDCPVPAGAEYWEHEGVTFYVGYSRSPVPYVGPQCTWTDQTKTTLIHHSCYDENGKQHGWSCSWYTTGQPWVKIEYKHGVLHGSYTEFYENGQPRTESSYTDGEYDGLQWQYHSNGNLQSEAYYTMGVLDGDARGWYENGQMSAETHFDNGVENGRRREWYEDGSLKLDCDIVHDENVYCRV